MAWDKSQVKSFVKQAKGKYGSAWQFLSYEQKKGAIALQFTMVVVGQAIATLNTEDMSELFTNMLVEAGLSDGENQEN